MRQVGRVLEAKRLIPVRLVTPALPAAVVKQGHKASLEILVHRDPRVFLARRRIRVRRGLRVRLVPMA